MASTRHCTISFRGPRPLHRLLRKFRLHAWASRGNLVYASSHSSSTISFTTAMSNSDRPLRLSVAFKDSSKTMPGNQRILCRGDRNSTPFCPLLYSTQYCSKTTRRRHRCMSADLKTAAGDKVSARPGASGPPARTVPGMPSLAPLCATSKLRLVEPRGPGAGLKVKAESPGEPLDRSTVMGPGFDGSAPPTPVLPPPRPSASSSSSVEAESLPAFRLYALLPSSLRSSQLFWRK